VEESQKWNINHREPKDPVLQRLPNAVILAFQVAYLEIEKDPQHQFQGARRLVVQGLVYSQFHNKCNGTSIESS
jgi:hypothetical protein